MNGTSRGRQPGRRLAKLALAAAIPVLLGAPALADRLVTSDGSVIEVRGPWKVQGRLVVFELPGGQLASLQLGEVDLEASRAASTRTEAPAVKPRASRPPEKAATFVLTDADVRRMPPPGGSAEEPAANGSEEGEPPDEGQRLAVGSWRETTDSDGVVITGELVNQSPDIAAGIQLAVLFYDREDQLLTTSLASVTAKMLKPGQRARFRAEGRGVFEYASLQFEASSLGFCGQLRDGGPCSQPEEAEQAEPDSPQGPPAEGL